MAEFIKNLKKKVEHYKTKAEEIRAMVEEGAETIRDIRADVESTVEDLKADSEEKLMERLEEIQEAERVLSLYEKLEDLDDVMCVHANFDIADSELERLAQ